MNKRLIILVSVLVAISVALLAFAFSESAVRNYDVATLIADKTSMTEDIEGIFEGYLFFYNDETNEAKISDKHPRSAINASSIEVKISTKTRKPQLFIGARIFVYGTYFFKSEVIAADKIEASCPSKEEDKLSNN
ncbi:MAG: hypothetical protein K8S87_12570 [Planctomycetes bacterium]|nr:hypothetical protein [Planctomycetota bacterium]